VRQCWIAAVALAICGAVSNAQAPIQLENRWTTALVRRDAHTFDQLLAPGFVYTENASVMDRSDVIKSVTGPDKVEWARNEGMKLHDFGNVQVITGVLHLRGKSGDESPSTGATSSLTPGRGTMVAGK
jgi:hypothetical protein